jgi:hypothetical protein
VLPSSPYNATQGTVSYTSSPLAWPFTGSTAEWVMEKPSEQIISYGFANFGHAEMDNAEAYTSNWVPHTITSDRAWQIWLYHNNTTLLCDPEQLSSGAITFTWYSYN